MYTHARILQFIKDLLFRRLESGVNRDVMFLIILHTHEIFQA